MRCCEQDSYCYKLWHHQGELGVDQDLTTTKVLFVASLILFAFSIYCCTHLLDPTLSLKSIKTYHRLFVASFALSILLPAIRLCCFSPAGTPSKPPSKKAPGAE